MKFVWDHDKAVANTRKHSVDFEEAQTVFSDGLARVVHDPDHSNDESRMLILGMSKRRRLLVVVFTERGEVIRLIGARRATLAERVNYEETIL
jgi:hypothetical protein